jgi:hypothetical protein
VVQEVALSTLDPLLTWGTATCPWKEFGEAVLWLQRKGYGAWQEPRLPLHRSQTLIDLSFSSNTWSLEALLQRTRRFEASDPRDFIYGLTAIAHETSDPSTWPTALLPDYDRATTEVFETRQDSSSRQRRG